MLKIAVLGSTGSVGSQTLDIVRTYLDQVKVVLIGASKPSKALERQVLEFNPDYVYIENFEGVEYFGSKVINIKNIEKIIDIDADIFINAVSGISGIRPTYILLKAGKKLATANKESIVCLGEMLRKEMKSVIPIDSEHSAIYQIIQNTGLNTVEKIVLTASGGPFLNRPASEFGSITVEEALNHPKWSMGKKITVDSATLLNKGFEVIEAHYLFGIPYEKIEVVIHPESIIHGMVEFVDGTMIANMSQPDMRIPISYAIFNGRKELGVKRLNMWDIGSLTFYKPDTQRFPLLKLAVECGKKGGIYPIILTVADEVAVELFLERKITFTDIHKFIEKALDEINIDPPSDIESLLGFVEMVKSKLTRYNIIKNYVV